MTPARRRLLYGEPARKDLRFFEDNDYGAAIAVEVWEMPLEKFGPFGSQVPAPLSIGSVLLEDGETVKGFLCEGYATHDALDISSFGGWREFLHRGPNPTRYFLF